MEYNRLTTGETCTLSKLFSKDNRVIVPDLQRDYCWGTKRDDKELVSDFVRNIIDKGFREQKGLSLGLLYGYETPIGHIQLCDGQQRITTLFLLLGMLNKNSNNEFQDQLISLFEYKEDDKEPYLQYSIRESSLYFLSDLVCLFFIDKNDLKVKDIIKQLWYFGDYSLDPSIQSMLSALDIIEREIKDVDSPGLGKYIINELSFIYYDMGNRKNGEETFVVINTTGEPLSVTENLKPLYIGAQKDGNHLISSEKWEEWETWFWKHREGNGGKINDTADNGYREFFRWITLLTTTKTEVFEKIQESGDFQFDVNIRIDEIEKYFNIILFLFEKPGIFSNNLDWVAPDKSNKNINTQIDWFRLLPVIEYIKNFGKDDIRNIIRVKTFFENLSRIGNVKKAIGTILPEAIKIIKELGSPDIAEIIKLTSVSAQILSLEERTKFEIYLYHKEHRLQIEDMFWKAESHNVWNGEILPMVNWASNNGEFNVDSFVEYDKVFCSLFHDTLEYDELDITRRALLTRGLKDYPRKFRGYANTSFCWEYSDWQLLIKDNEVKFGDFLKELISVSNIVSQQLEMIHKNPPNSDWDEFVKIPELLKFCTQKNIQYSDKYGWLLLHGQKASGAYANLMAYRLYLDMKSMPFWDPILWKFGFYDHEGSCVNFTSLHNNTVIDVIHFGEDEYILQVFGNQSVSINFLCDLSSLAENMNLTWNGQRYESAPINRKDITNIIQQIQTLTITQSNTSNNVEKV